ncbi:MAG: exo-alpha-sialidase, partial [Candidatus Hydrogenedentes bacterium]|nr:exo-alpha-sialidase [Candidatus Hydrogenedentota bacterium]
MKSYEKNRSFKGVSIRGFKGFGCLLATLILTTVVSLSAQAQLTPGAPAVLNTNNASDTGGDLDTVVRTNGAGNWVAVWRSDEDLGSAGTDSDIFVATSTDNGTTWTAPALLNTNNASDTGDDFNPALVTDGAGNWVAVWDSDENLNGTAGIDRDVFVATSTDNGTTWTAPAVLNTNGTADTGNDLDPQVTTDGAGNWVAVWHSNENLGGAGSTEDDIFVSRSTDNGATWTAPALLNTNATTDTGADRVPQVTTDGAGNWVAAWWSADDMGATVGTDRDIFVSRSTDNGATWTALALLNTNGASDSGEDFDPQVTTDGAGNWVTVWYSNENLGGAGTDRDIFVATSTDNGATWTAPALLNTNGTTDTRSDNRPQVTTDGAGSWVAVWDSDEDLGGTAGTDFDIFVATSADNGVSWTAPALLNINGVSDTGFDSTPRVTTDGVGN